MGVSNIVEGFINQLSRGYKKVSGIKFAEKPVYDYDFAKQKRESKFKFYGIGFSHTTSYRINVNIFQHAVLSDSELSHFYGFYNAATIGKKDLFPCAFQLGIAIDKPTPGGFVLGLDKINYIGIRNPDTATKETPISALIQSDKKLKHLLSKLRQKTWEGNMSYRAPARISVTPWKKKTIACVYCVCFYKKKEKYELLHEKKKVNVPIPTFDEVPAKFEILKRIQKYVTQFDFEHEVQGFLPNLQLPQLIASKLKKT